MEFLDVLKKKVEELVYLELDKGVSPIELASSIYEEDYTEVKIKRQFGNIHCSVQFFDTEFFDDRKVKHEYRYIYDCNNYLQEIHHVLNKKKSLIWSRADESAKIIKEICEIASYTDKAQLVNFPIEKLPEEARAHLGRS
ncbi:hypothetical protein [Paenibacillus sp. 453mf]|uniref:hypothetical protein n=1 Tax=Paenibacillus sp. 453mf TaxID=1761874 RepID=UPI0008F09A18|nr:hypothetical protein [Paenibacillus sp. 453mf]SFS76795.1 hypothetical protein SAMN04488601_10398 [Paenibacillus sp. 453mf]